MCEYKTYTINSLISSLQQMKKQGIDGNTIIHLSDFEHNYKHTKFEIAQVQDEQELFLLYELHESEK